MKLILSLEFYDDVGRQKIAIGELLPSGRLLNPSHTLGASAHRLQPAQPLAAACCWCTVDHKPCFTL